jgi:hypothetical protein
MTNFTGSLRSQNGQFVVGHPGMGGRPAGQRNKLSEPFLQALADDFRQHGEAAIQRVRTELPHRYLAIIASLCPKELHIERSSPLAELSDTELDLIEQTLRAGRARLVPELEPDDTNQQGS